MLKMMAGSDIVNLRQSSADLIQIVFQKFFRHSPGKFWEEGDKHAFDKLSAFLVSLEQGSDDGHAFFLQIKKKFMFFLQGFGRPAAGAIKFGNHAVHRLGILGIGF